MYAFIAILIAADFSAAGLILKFEPRDIAIILVGMSGSIITPVIGGLLVKVIMTNMEGWQASLQTKRVPLHERIQVNGEYQRALTELMAIRTGLAANGG